MNHYTPSDFKMQVKFLKTLLHWRLIVETYVCDVIRISYHHIYYVSKELYYDITDKLITMDNLWYSLFISKDYYDALVNGNELLVLLFCHLCSGTNLLILSERGHPFNYDMYCVVYISPQLERFFYILLQ